MRFTFDNDGSVRVNVVATSREQAIRRALTMLSLTERRHVDGLIVWHRAGEKPERDWNDRQGNDARR